MGLVATWLNGIGLGDVIPTFQAAGIVTPTALAELDVTHFEALGVSNADDRRKLFYLVQRIKIAVNRDNENSTLGDKIDSMISGTMDLNDDDDDDVDGDDDDDDGHNDNDDNHQNQISTNSRSFSNNDASFSKSALKNQQTTTATTDNIDQQFQTRPRRSKRLAAKQQHHHHHQQQQHVAPSRAKENQSQNLADSSTKSLSLQPLHSSATSIITTSEERTARQSQSEITDYNDNDNDNDNHLENDNDDDDGDRPADKMEVSFNSNDVENNNPDDTSRSKATTTTLLGKNNGSTKQISMQTESEIAKPKRESRMQQPRTRRYESRVQNPSKSMRTGKQLSSIPSESIAPISPLVNRTPSQLDSEGEKRSTSRIRGRSTDSLDELLRSDSESSMEYNDPRQRSRGQSLGGSESRITMAAQRRKQSSRRSHSESFTEGQTDSRLKNRNSYSGVKTRSGSGLTKPAASFVHGTQESGSWGTMVAELREDNDAEHELFSSEALEYGDGFDMSIRVVVRKRPMSANELTASGGIDVIHPLDYGDYGRILVYQPKTRVDLTKEVETIPFAFDNVFGEFSTNRQIYTRAVKNLIPSLFEGQWGTIFAYGQTGSGKTYTMMGSNMTGIRAGTATSDEQNLGLYYLAALDVFEMAKRPEYSHLSIGVSLFEIYGGKLFDLINRRKLIKCLEDSRGKVCFPGLTEHPASDPDRLMELIAEGARNRSTGSTSRNADSSRSHAVLQLCLRKNVGRRKNVEHGRLTFIDLAGSERGADTSSSSRATRLEGAEINTSLLALKEVIRALATGGSMTHIPFRGSKLTQVLKESFVGENSRCVMIACIGPESGNCEQTLNTLRYADRVKERDSENGALSSNYLQPTKARSATITNSENLTYNDEDTMDDNQVSSTDIVVPNKADEVEIALEDHSKICAGKNYVSDCDADELDELLSPPSSMLPPENAPQEVQTVVEVDIVPASPASKLKAGEALISAHRSVMASMLGMVKNEMALVNQVDADRDGLDDYLNELTRIQDTQLNQIASLQKAIQTYREFSADGAPRDDDSDGSFEDLRD